MEEKMRGLVLYGANCTIDIWEAWKREFIEFDLVFVEYPHDILQTSIFSCQLSFVLV
jgi:hypothetical protein